MWKMSFVGPWTLVDLAFVSVASVAEFLKNELDEDGSLDIVHPARMRDAEHIRQLILNGPEHPGPCFHSESFAELFGQDWLL